MNELEVVCAMIYQDEQVLIAQRLSKIANQIWEFPGGKVEKGESQVNACIREIKEELSIDIAIDGFLCDVVDTAFTPPVHVYAYRAHRVSGEIVLHAHSQYKWLDPKDVFAYSFQKADQVIIKCIQKE